MTTEWDDSNWREEYKGSWMMGALHNKWRKMKGYKYPQPPDCSSSFAEWNQKAEELANG